MGNTAKRIVIAGGIFTVGYALYWLYKKTLSLQGKVTASGMATTLTNVVSGHIPVISGGDESVIPQQSGFPIKMGSKGPLVITLQQALKRRNANALPKYGIDGDFGSETQAELSKQYNGLIQVKDQAALDAIVNYTGTGVPMVLVNNSGNSLSQSGLGSALGSLNLSNLTVPSLN